MRLMSARGSLLIDMLTVPSPFGRCRRSPDFSRKFSAHSTGWVESEIKRREIFAPPGKRQREAGINVLESLVQMDVARHGDRPWNRQYARLRPRPRHCPQ